MGYLEEREGRGEAAAHMAQGLPLSLFTHISLGAVWLRGETASSHQSPGSVVVVVGGGGGGGAVVH